MSINRNCLAITLSFLDISKWLPKYTHETYLLKHWSKLF